MVPDLPSLSRRHLLGGIAGLLAGGTVAVGATEPTLLPDSVTDRATQFYPTPPEVSSHWRPAVTKAHATEVVELLESTVSDGKRLWSQLDTEEDFLGAGGWLENAQEALRKGNYHEALFDATYGMQFAGESLGVARARLSRANLQALAERSDGLLVRAASVATDLRPYPTSDAPRDLAWYYHIERELVFARQHARWDGMAAASDGGDDEDGPDRDEYTPRMVGEITSGVRQAEIHVLNAERYREQAAARITDAEATYGSHLRAVVGQFRDRLESFPSHGEVRSRYIDEDDDPYGPYEFAHSRLARWCFQTNYSFGWDESDDLFAHRAVELSRGVAQRRAHEFAVKHLVVDPDDESFDSGHTLAEKRRARAAYRSVVGANPPPLLTIQVRRAVEDLQVAKVGFGGHDQRPIWRERLKAYLYALVGRAKLRQYPAVYETLVSRPPG